MTGIRSWTVEVTAFGVVVRIEQDLIHFPLGSLHRSQSPANANSSLASLRFATIFLQAAADILRFTGAKGVGPAQDGAGAKARWGKASRDIATDGTCEGEACDMIRVGWFAW